MKKTKYKYGTNNSTVKNYIETPAEALAQNNINIAKAKYAGETDPLVNFLRGLGAATMTASSFVGGGAKAPSGEVSVGDMATGGNFEMGIGDFSSVAAFGGKKTGNVEVEGKEVIETPNGTVTQVQGPSHEAGGVDLYLPNGSVVYSDRIKIGNKTIAQRKKSRESILDKLNKTLSKNPSDKINKDTYERSKTFLDKEEENDLKVQKFIGESMKTSNTKLGLGDDNFIADDPYGQQYGTEITPDIQYEIENGISPIGTNNDVLDNNKNIFTDFFKNLKTKSGNINAPALGDALSIGGDLFSAFAPYINTLRNRANDTPNVNSFKDYGKDGIDKLDQAGNFIKAQESKALQDINNSARTARTVSRNSSRGVNTQRAFDVFSETQANKAKSDVYDNISKQMLQLLTQQAGLENQQDSVVMQGEANRDLADRQDKDNFNTQLSTNLSGMGQGIQQIGKDVNQLEQNKIMMNLLNQMSTYFKVDKKGNITAK